MEEIYAETAVVRCLEDVLKQLLSNHLLRKEGAMEVFKAAVKVTAQELKKNNSTGSYDMSGELACYRQYRNVWIFWIKNANLRNLPGGIRADEVKLVVAPKEFFNE